MENVSCEDVYTPKEVLSNFFDEEGCVYYFETSDIQVDNNGDDKRTFIIKRINKMDFKDDFLQLKIRNKLVIGKVISIIDGHSGDYIITFDTYFKNRPYKTEESARKYMKKHNKKMCEKYNLI